MPPTNESFAAFYALYPRHVARKAAEKAWSRVATSEAIIKLIMIGLNVQLPEMLTTYKRNRSMVPHPASWLNGRRWEDENALILTARNFNVCHFCGGAGTVLLGPPVLEIRWCSCQPYAGETIAAIHPDDWQAYSKVLAACAGQGR